MPIGGVASGGVCAFSLRSMLVFFNKCPPTSQLYSPFVSPPSPFSVANTGKRAFLIWTSILLFGNEVTFLSGLGTAIVILGVLLYNIAIGADARTGPKIVHVGGSGKMFTQKV